MSTAATIALRGPAKQARSRQTRERLVTAGIRLFESRDFETIAIAELAEAAGCSVGAVYHHFADKQAYYAAVMEAQLAGLWHDFEDRFRPEDLAGLDTRELLTRAIGFMRAIMCDNQGLLRTSLRRSMYDPEHWAPIRAFARAYDQRLAELLADRAGDFGVDDWPKAFRYGMQIVYSTLLNAIQNRPEPMKIEDPLIAEVLSDVLIRYMEVR